jgi:hypothetical protein
LSRFFSYTGKRKKKKDEVGQSGVLPFFAANSSFAVLLWNESSRTLKVQIKAVFPIRKVTDQAQLGVESVLCAGRIHGFRPPLCRKGRAFDLSELQMVMVNIYGWMQNYSFLHW